MFLFPVVPPLAANIPSFWQHFRTPSILILAYKYTSFCLSPFGTPKLRFLERPGIRVMFNCRLFRTRHWSHSSPLCFDSFPFFPIFHSLLFYVYSSSQLQSFYAFLYILYIYFFFFFFFVLISRAEMSRRAKARNNDRREDFFLFMNETWFVHIFIFSKSIVRTIKPFFTKMRINKSLLCIFLWYFIWLWAWIFCCILDIYIFLNIHVLYVIQNPTSLNRFLFFI